MLALISRLFSMPLAMRVSLLARIGLIALNFATTLVAARLYGPVANGQIGLIAAILGITSVVSLGGYQMLVLKELSGDAENLNETLTGSLVRVTIGAILVGLGLNVVIIPHFGGTYETSLGAQLLLVLPVVAAGNTYRVFLFETMRSREAIIGYNLLKVAGPLALCILLPFLPKLVPGLSFAWLVVISEALGLTIVLMMFIANGRGLKLVPIKLSNLRNRAGPFYVSTLSVAAYNLDIFILGTLLPAGELGIYVVTSRLAGIVAVPMTTAGIGYAPQVARIFRAEGTSAAIEHTRQTTRAFVPLSLLLAALIIGCGQPILSFLGPGFRQSYSVLVLLVSANMALVLTGHTGLMLTMGGHERLQQFNFILSAVTMLALLFLLVPVYGIYGGGIALMAGAAVRAIFGSIAVGKIYGTGISAFHVYFRKSSAVPSSDKD